MCAEYKSTNVQFDPSKEHSIIMLEQLSQCHYVGPIGPEKTTDTSHASFVAPRLLSQLIKGPNGHVNTIWRVNCNNLFTIAPNTHQRGL